MEDPGLPARRRITAFVSSAMQELQPERDTIRSALLELKVDPWVYEIDAGARDRNIRSLYTTELAAADLYIAVFWKQYGEYTIDEYRQAVTRDKPRLVFLKRAAADERDPRLRAFLDEIAGVDGDRSTRWFFGPDDLRDAVKTDVAGWLADRVRATAAADAHRPFLVEGLGDRYVERGALLAQARQAWLSPDGGPPRVTRAAFHGLPGSGKSVMARAFAHDPAVSRAFPDGVLAATFGRDAAQALDVTRLQSAWGRALRDRDMPPAGYPDAVTGTSQLRSLLQNRACLLVLDDVWDARDVRPLLAGGPRCLLLITTRQLDVVNALGASGIELAPMTAPEGIGLVECWCGPLSGADLDIATALGAEVGWLPLALELMAARAKELGWAVYQERWRTQRLKALRRGWKSRGREDSVTDSLELSYESLGQDAEWYRQLAVFGAATPFPASAAAALWGVDEGDARDALDGFSGQALLDQVGPPSAARFMLHSLLHEYLVERMGPDLAAAHWHLASGYLRRSTTGWAGVPDDGYFGERLAYHLMAAGRVEELWALLDRPWMQAQFTRAASHAPFLADLRVGMQAAGRDPIDAAAFVRCAVIHMIVSTLVAEDPPGLAAAFARLGDVERALACADAIPREDYRVTAFVDVAATLLEQGRTADALAAAERAVAAAQEDPTGYRAAESLARAAACLGRCGRDTSAELARARAMALGGLETDAPGAVAGLAAVAVGYAAIDRADESAAVAEQMVQTIAGAGDDATYMFGDSAVALRTIGAARLLERLTELAIARLREGAGGYPLSNVVPELAAAGQVETAVAAARQIPDKGELCSALAKIAARMAAQGKGAEAAAILEEAIRAFEVQVRAAVSNWSYARELLAASAALGLASSLDHLEDLAVERDPVWDAWFVAGLARAHHRSGTGTSRVTALAEASVRILREASEAGPLSGEAVRAETAGFLAEAGAVTEAAAVAAGIDDSEHHKRALIAIADAVLAAGRPDAAGGFLQESMGSGAPDPLTGAINEAHAALALARVGDAGRALGTIESCLQTAAALSPEGWERAGILTLAVDLFGRCSQPERARHEAALALDLLARPQGPFLEFPLRRTIVHLAGRTIGDEAVESVASNELNWFFRRTIAAGAVRGFIAAERPERARAFFDELDFERRQYPPWGEGLKAEALRRMFEVPDDQVREWVRRAAEAIETPSVRSVLRARLAGTLAKQGHPEAAGLARLGPETPAAEVASAFAEAGQADLTHAALAGVTDADVVSHTIGTLAMALVEGRRGAEAVDAVRTITADSARGHWITLVGERLLRTAQYDRARELLAAMPGWADGIAHDFAIAHCAVAMARDGHAEQASRLVEPAVLRAEAAAASGMSSGHALVTAEAALALAHLGAHQRSLALARAAAAQDTGRWGPFVSCDVAACHALAGDATAARTFAAEAIRQLRRAADEDVPPRLEMIARIWSDARLDEGESLLAIVRDLAGPWVRVQAIHALARATGGGLVSPPLQALIDIDLEDAWARVQALQAIVEAAARRGDRSTIQRVLDVSQGIGNVWARGELTVALARAAAAMDDEELLTASLSMTSELRSVAWQNAAAVAAASAVLAARGESARAQVLARRALEIAAGAVAQDDRDRATYDAERVSCLALIGREDEAVAAIDAAVAHAARQPAGFRRDAIYDALDVVLEDAAPLSVLSKLTSVTERPDIVGGAAVRMAASGRLTEASAAMAAAAGSPRLTTAMERTPVLFQRARFLAAAQRTGEGLACALEALDSGRTLPARHFPYVVARLSETLADLGHRGGVSSLAETLATTAAWWRRGPRAPS